MLSLCKTNMTTGERTKALELAISQIEKRFGKGSIMKLGETTTVQAAGIIPTALFHWTSLSASGAYPGDASLKFSDLNPPLKPHWPCILSQRRRKKGGVAAYIDGGTCAGPSLFRAPWSQYRRRAHFPTRYRRTGSGDLRSFSPKWSRGCYRGGQLAALVPRAEIEGEMGDSQVALQARLMSQALRKLAWRLADPEQQWFLSTS